MRSGIRFANELRRLLRLASVVASLLVIGAPAAFGPAMGPVLEQLGAAGEHSCKCGMAKGHCGCPMCEQLDHQRQREQIPAAVPVLRRQCEQDAPAMTFAPMPLCGVLPVLATLPGPTGTLATFPPGALAPPFSEPEPPTPPPRLAAV